MGIFNIAMLNYERLPRVLKTWFAGKSAIERRRRWVPKEVNLQWPCLITGGWLTSSKFAEFVVFIIRRCQPVCGFPWIQACEHNPCRITMSDESRCSGLDTISKSLALPVLEALLLAIDKLCQPSATALGKKDFGDALRNGYIVWFCCLEILETLIWGYLRSFGARWPVKSISLSMWNSWIATGRIGEWLQSRQHSSRLRIQVYCISKIAFFGHRFVWADIVIAVLILIIILILNY